MMMMVMVMVMVMMMMMLQLSAAGSGHGISQADDYGGGGDGGAPEMDPVESEAVYRILESINGGVAWRALHPHANLCLYGPHGLACDAHPTTTTTNTNNNNSRHLFLHVVELSLGWVSDTDNNAACGAAASVDVAALRRLRFLRKLMLYRCFVHAEADIGPIIAAVSETLAHLVVMDNPALTGAAAGLPASIGRLRRLERLVVVRNPRLRGPLAAEIGRLRRLEEVALSENGLTGSLPAAAIGSLQALKILDLRGNSFHGPLPDEVSGLGSLLKLDVSWNGLSGPIPPAIGGAARLELLDLSHNRFTGGVPASLGRLANLRVLEMGANPDLGGDLPDIWAAMGGRLRRLSVSGCRLAGRLPPSLGHLHSLSSLDVSNNSLRGGVGLALGSLPRLYRVDLRNNRLAGMLAFPPEAIQRLGRNLLIDGNPGLCVAADWVQHLSGQVVGAAHPCSMDDDEDASHFLPQDTFSAAWALERDTGSSSRIDPTSGGIASAASILAALFLL